MTQKILKAAAKRYVQPFRCPVGALPEELRLHRLEGRLDYGLPVFTNLLECRQPPAIYLLVHGYGGYPGVWKRAAEELIRLGRAVMIPAMRGQTISPVDGVSFGPGEADEVIEAAEWARLREPASRLVLVGVSLGGAASWIAAERRPELFDAVATEACFAELKQAVYDYIVPAPFLRPVFDPIVEAGETLLGVPIHEVRPVESIRAWRGRPGLLIHSVHDRAFRLHHGEALARASGLELWSGPFGRHSVASKRRPQEYIEKVRLAAGDY
jgi:pimeloyl-ACP methyl ester carboxylesterase